jgi:hypothetical protein
MKLLCNHKQYILANNGIVLDNGAMHYLPEIVIDIYLFPENPTQIINDNAITYANSLVLSEIKLILVLNTIPNTYQLARLVNLFKTLLYLILQIEGVGIGTWSIGNDFKIG